MYQTTLSVKCLEFHLCDNVKFRPVRSVQTTWKTLPH